MTVRDSIEKIISRNVTKHKYRLAGKRLNKIFNGISPGDYTLITGLAATGKRSFVDFYYMLRILAQWDKLSEEEKISRPLKITYFSTKYSLDYKIMKWVAALHTMQNSIMMDVPTILQSAGRLFTMGNSMYEKVISKASLIDRAIEAGVLELIDFNITPITIEKKLNDILESQGDISYTDEGKTLFTAHEENETLLNIVIIDDLNHINSGSSAFGEGKMEATEISNSIDAVLVKYSKLGMSITAVKRTDNSKLYGKYLPSVKEMNGVSPTKCIVMYDPVRDYHKEYIMFELDTYIDDYGINRLKFAFIAYSETGISNINLPLLFMPENGIFAELKLINREEDHKYNEKLFASHVLKRNNTKPKK